ncbi:hypothetical protein B4U80_13629 [Leptotrombidium deliense]|uniref:Uncharacterized protein n=1 Tax=Leptotrombidium deliense TaxID=299467 RepID=A0A443SRZ7_9ACAR|nr:hypothetical protein B4U80_13629 [Leptotrombidium deliense]
MTENTLLKYNDIETALDHVSEAWGKQHPGSWFCIRVGKSILKSKLARESEQYVFMKIPPIDVYLFKLYDSSSGHTAQTETEMIEASRLEVDLPEQIYQNNLPEDQKNEAFFALKWGIQNNNNFGEIEETVKGTMESKFGGEWRCFVMCRESKVSSTTGAGIIDIRKQSISSIEPLIYFGIGKLKCLIYKPAKAKENGEDQYDKISYKMYDVIKEARRNIHHVEVNQTEMSEARQDEAIYMVKQAIKIYDTYEGMSRYCRDYMDSKHGKPWECMIGTDGQFWTYFWYQRPFIINFKIDRIRVLIIKQFGNGVNYG